jgi:signal transduction histidine kinase
MMQNQDLFLFIGQKHISSQIESILEDGTVVLKETTAEGIQYIQNSGTPPDCIVTDHNPPAQDCFRLLESVPPDLPVILAPTGGSSKLATRALRAGAKTYLDTTSVETAPTAIVTEIKRVATERPTEIVQNQPQRTPDDRIKEFASIVSHELRSPLQKAKSSVDLAKTECNSPYLDDIENTVADLDQLVDNLLDRLRDGEARVEMTAVDLATVVADSWPDHTTAAVAIESELPTINAERSRLRQLLTNLFQNSIDHGNENVTVRIGVIDPVDDAVDAIGLYIADDGPGIEPDIRESVFEYGYTGSRDGTGFGLAIVKEIVDAFGWNVTVTESRTGGVRFEIHQIRIV